MDYHEMKHYLILGKKVNSCICCFSEPRGVLSSPVVIVSVLDVFLIVLFLFLYVEQEPSQIPPAEAGPSWGAQAELSSKPASLQARQLKGQRLFPLLSSCFLCL